MIACYRWIFALIRNKSKTSLIIGEPTPTDSIIRKLLTPNAAALHPELDCSAIMANPMLCPLAPKPKHMNDKYSIA